MVDPDIKNTKNKLLEPFSDPFYAFSGYQSHHTTLISTQFSISTFMTRCLTSIHVSMAKPCGRYDNAKCYRPWHSLSRTVRCIYILFSQLNSKKSSYFVKYSSPKTNSIELIEYTFCIIKANLKKLKP